MRFYENIRISGIIVQGTADVTRYVTKFKVALANDNTLTQWTDYTDFDGNVVGKIKSYGFQVIGGIRGAEMKQVTCSRFSVNRQNEHKIRSNMS